LGVTRQGLEELKAKDPEFTLWASVGRFGRKHDYRDDDAINRQTELAPGRERPGRVAAVLKAGFFESSGQHDDKYREVKAAFDRHLAKVRWKWV
jgi:hypothetical protein